MAAIFAVAAPPAEAQTPGTFTFTSDIDRDSNTDGVQINEGDTVTLTLTANGLTSGEAQARIRVRGGAVDAGDLTSVTVGGILLPINSLPLESGGTRLEFGRDVVTLGVTTLTQQVQVVSLNDNAPEPDETFVVETYGVRGIGSNTPFDTNASITITILESDGYGATTLAITVDDADTTEGDTAEFTVTLTAGVPAPTYPVTVDWAVSGDVDSSDHDASGGTLTFSAAGSQTINIAIAADLTAESAEDLTVTLSNPSAGATITTAEATTAIAANTLARRLTLTGPATVAEGTEARYTVALQGTPFANPTEVTWTITHADSGGTSDADFGGAGGLTGSITFPTQTSFSITPLDDDFVESAEAFSVQLSVADDDADGGTAFGAAAMVSVADNDMAGLVIAPAELSVAEGGGAEYTARLATQPVDAAASVTVAISGGGATVTVVPATLTFTAASWNAPQTVKVTAADAEFGDAGMASATLTHAVTGTGEYANSDSSLNERLTVTVTALPDAVAARALTVTCDPATVAEGASATCAINIGAGDMAFTNPTAVMWEVTHGDTVDADFAAGTGGSVMFPTATTFAIATADDNFVESAESFTVQIAVADDSADGGTAFGDAARVSIADNDEAGLVIAPAELSVAEGGEAAYTARLATQPVDAAASVTVAISGGGATVTVAPATLTFTSASWNAPQTVTVTAADAEFGDAGMASATLTHAVAGTGEYANADSALNERLTVTVTALPAVPAVQAPHQSLLPEVTRAVAGEVFSAIARRAGTMDDSVGRPATAGLIHKMSFAGAAAFMRGLAAGNDTADFDPKELLRGLEFALPLSAGASRGGGGIAFWGGSDYRDFSGENDDSDWDGSLLSLRFGVDGQMRRNLRAGLMVSSSDSASEYTQVVGGNSDKGDYELDLTSVSPYLSWKSGDGGSAWASVSYGSGEVEVKPNDGEASTNDVKMTGIAAGGSWRLRQAGAHQMRMKADVFVAQTEVEGGEDGGVVEDVEVDANRARVALAWQRLLDMSGGANLTRTFDLGVRHDGGDGRGGAGMEVGGQLRYHNAARGLTLQAQVRALLGHTGDHREWGVGGLVRMAAGADGQGLSLSLTPKYGDSATDPQGLWNNGMAAGGQSADPEAQLGAELGYGMPMAAPWFGLGGASGPFGGGVLTPYSALRLGETARDYRLGLKWSAAQRLDLNLSTRRTAADNAFTLEGKLRF